jgi:glycosyltransferase involved in cell wall biosynthesis
VEFLKVCIVTHKKIYAIKNKLFAFGGYFPILQQFLKNINELTLIATGTTERIQNFHYLNKESNKLQIIILKNTDSFINKLLWQFALILELVKLQKFSRFHLINIQIPSLYKLPFPLILAKLFNIPIVLSIHGNLASPSFKPTLLQSLLKSIELIALRISLQFASGVITANSQIGDKIRSLRFNKPLQVIPYGADLSRFNPSVGKITNFTPFILFVGQISKAKGVNSLFESFLKIKLKQPELKLLLIGQKGKNYTIPNSIIKELNKSIHLLGYLPQKEVARYMRTAEIVILPSLSEGLPKVLCEALACGTPVIGTRIAGIDEIIIDEKNGILVSPNNIDELTTSIEKILSSKELSHQYSEHGQKIIQEKFNLELNIKKFIRFFQKILQTNLKS